MTSTKGMCTSVVQYLGRLKWNHRHTVLETAELFWQTGHRSTWPGLCAQCSWSHGAGGGDHISGWCNHTNKAPSRCVIVALIPILCVCSNWTLERIFPVCLCLCVCMSMWYLEGAGSSCGEAGRPFSLAFVDQLLCEFCRGLLRGPRCSHAYMTHSVLSVYQPSQVYNPV